MSIDELEAAIVKASKSVADAHFGDRRAAAAKRRLAVEISDAIRATLGAESPSASVRAKMRPSEKEAADSLIAQASAQIDAAMAKLQPMDAARFDALAADIEKQIMRGHWFIPEAIVPMNVGDVRAGIQRGLRIYYVREEPKLPLMMSEEGFAILLESMREVADAAANGNESVEDAASRVLRKNFDLTVGRGLDD